MDLDQLEEITGGTYEEAMAFLRDIAHGRGWDPNKIGYIITHMTDEECARYEALLDSE